MTDKRHAEPNLDRQDRQNTIVVGLMAGALSGFILAMMMGAFGIGGKEEEGITNWLQGVAGVIATLISVLAVYLVAQTLKATRETLDATRKMAADQKRIGDAQTRPWLLVSECRVYRDEEYSETAHIRLKNFGPTPARFVTIRTRVWDSEDGRTDTFPYDDATSHYLAPHQDILITRDLSHRHPIRYSRPLLNLRVTYFSIHDLDTEQEYHVNLFLGHDGEMTTIALI